MKNIVVEIDKALHAQPHLQQLYLQLGSALLRNIPRNLNLQFAVRPATGKPLGEEANYHALKNVDRYVPVKTGKHTIWHGLHQESQFVPRKKGKFILTIHDLSFLEKPGNPFGMSWKMHNMANKIDRADIITTFSQRAADQLRDRIKRFHKPVHVVYPGITIQPGSTDPIDNKPGEKFLLTYHYSHKKLGPQTLFPLLRSFSEHYLAIAGPTAAAPPHLLQEAKKAGLHDRIRYYGPLEEQAKWWLLRNCEAVCLPVVDQAGIAVLEAFGAGKPVFLPEHAGVEEICNGHATYWQSFDPGHMCQLYGETIESFNSELALGRVEQAQRFSWDRAAGEFCKLYNDL